VIVAPLVIRGEVEFGMLAQGQMAFFLVMGAFSVIVKEFQRISTFGAVIERLGAFCEALPEVSGSPQKCGIEVVEDDTRVAFDGLTLVTPGDGRPLVADLTVEVLSGQRLLIIGPSGSGRTSLLRAVAGLWPAGQGRILRPALAELLFLPQQPYLPGGSLRDLLRYGGRQQGSTEGELRAALRQVGFAQILERLGGLDAEADWAHTLSLGEQQRLVFARLLLAGPRFAFLDEATSALDPESARQLHEVLAATGIASITLASDAALAGYHDQVIELGPDGSWSKRLDFARPPLVNGASSPCAARCLTS
jgi:putative ATP-binding cassette transporter